MQVRTQETKRKTKKKEEIFGSFTSSAEIIAQGLVGPSKQLKQIIQIAHNIVKNPSNWLEVNQLAIYKCGRGFEFGATVKQIHVVIRVGPELRTTGVDRKSVV